MLTVTAPAPIGTVTKAIYNAYGQATSIIANRVDDVPSGSTGLDDVVSTQTYDAFGNRTAVIADDGSFPGAIKAKTATTYDQAGAVVATTVYADSGWTQARTTTNHFETYTTGGVTYTRLAASGVVLPIAPTGAPAPLCPEAGTSTRCNSVSTLDLNGLVTATTDAYGVVSLADVDLAGRSVQATTNYVAGGGHGTDNDANLVSSTAYTVLGDVARTVDPSSRSAVVVLFDTEWLLKTWQRVVAEVESGYVGTIDDYTNDLTVRDRLDANGLDDIALADLDRRFRKATKADPSRRLGAYATPGSGWWWRRIPVNLASLSPYLAGDPPI